MKETKTSSKPLVIERTFNTPASKVWEAWSDSEKLKQWNGPKNYSCPRCEIDFRVGGKVFTAMRSDTGKEMYSTGNYLEIVPHKKIVMTDNFADSKGNVISPEEAGMPGEWNEDLKVTVELQEEDNKTRMTITHSGIPPEMSDDCVQGWEEMVDKLEKMLSAKGRTTM
jgi:uncharacterized protein YndB with AHSA1/START domain